MNEMESSRVFEAAARATINERCASAFLHDVRGSMQALFSAVELLGRSARMGGGDTLRIEKACDLAKRAITQHEKSTMEILQFLTLQNSEATSIDMGSLVRDAVHFLRNDAGNKEVTLNVAIASESPIWAERAKLQTMLFGLLTAAIDSAAPGTELLIGVELIDSHAVVTIGTDAGYGGIRDVPDGVTADALPRSGELTLLFARQCLAANGGHLEIDPDVRPDGTIRIFYPSITPARSRHPAYPLEQNNIPASDGL